MIVYALGPIDVWFGWSSFAEVLTIAAKPFDARIDWCHHSANKLQAALTHAYRLAALLGWDNDLREGPYFSPLPENNIEPAAFLLAWKQDNNGTTYVASPYRLPWLDKTCSDWADDENGVYLGDLGRAKILLRRQFPDMPAATINSIAKRQGIPMRTLRHATRSLGIPWDQCRDIGQSSRTDATNP